MSYELLIPMLGIADQIGYVVIPKTKRQKRDKVLIKPNLFTDLNKKFHFKHKIILNNGYVLARL